MNAFTVERRKNMGEGPATAEICATRLLRYSEDGRKVLLEFLRTYATIVLRLTIRDKETSPVNIKDLPKTALSWLSAYK